MKIFLLLLILIFMFLIYESPSFIYQDYCDTGITLQAAQRISFLEPTYSQHLNKIERCYYHSS